VVVEVAVLWTLEGARASRSGVTIRELSDKRCAVSVRPLKASAVGDVLYFTGAPSHKNLKISGLELMPLTLRAETDVNDRNVLKLAADVSALGDCTTSLWLQVEGVSGAIEKLVTAPLEVSHKDSSGARLFKMESGSVEEASANERRKCKICNKELVDAGAALQHSAHHILHTPTLVLYSEMCPLCFGPSSECPPFLVKTNGDRLQPRIVCSSFKPAANLNDPDSCVRFSAGTLKKSTNHAPSTNRPIICPACNPDLVDDSNKRKSKVRPAVWSYNMKAHWDRLHASTEMPAALESDIAVSQIELLAPK